MRRFVIFVIAILITFYKIPSALAFSTTTAILVKTTQANLWRPPSPDSSGITYIPSLNQLLVADSEVEELSLWAGANLFYTGLDTPPVKTGNTTIWRVNPSREPTGLSYDRDSNLLYVSDDDAKRINIVNSGPDSGFGTLDDSVTYFSTNTFGQTDPESVAVSPTNIFIGNGIYHSFIKTTKTGTKIAQYDTSSYNLIDIEGITYNYDTNTVFVLSANPRLIGEFTTDGQFIRLIDISQAASRAPADLVFAPTSTTTDSPAIKNMYIVARGVDNGADPNENDGRVYEMSIPGQFPGPTNTPSPLPTNFKLGDANLDGNVDIIDIGIVIDNYGRLPIPNPRADINHDGNVDIIDIGIVIDNYGI